jgi:hypothetical protein
VGHGSVTNKATTKWMSKGLVWMTLLTSPPGFPGSNVTNAPSHAWQDQGRRRNMGVRMGFMPQG